MNTKISIIIPVRKINDYIKESIPHIEQQSYRNFEVIIFPDEAEASSFGCAKVIPTEPLAC